MLLLFFFWVGCWGGDCSFHTKRKQKTKANQIKAGAGLDGQEQVEDDVRDQDGRQRGNTGFKKKRKKYSYKKIEKTSSKQNNLWKNSGP